MRVSSITSGVSFNNILEGVTPKKQIISEDTVVIKPKVEDVAFRKKVEAEIKGVGQNFDEFV